jgi:nitroreductase
MTDVIELKRAASERPVHELIASRFSPYQWLEQDVDPADLAALFEAARWAPSAYNEQPARYIVATRADGAEFDRLLSCLVEGNRAWARHVPVLGLGVIATQFARNGTDNPVAQHDLGLASANLTLEATARGLSVHQMSGILPDAARETYAIPEGFVATTGIAIGYANPASDNERDQAPRSRRALAETVFTSAWNTPAPLG